MSRERRRGRTAVIGAQALICAIAALGSLFRAHTTAQEAVPLCWAITALFCWSLWSWGYVNGTLFDPYGLFLLSLFMFNAGQAMLEPLALNERSLLDGMFGPDVLVPTLYMVLLGLTFAHLGGLLAVARSSVVPRSRVVVEDGHSLRIVASLLLLVSVVPTIVLLSDALLTAASGGYFALYQRDLVTGTAATPQVLSLFMVPGALLLLAGARGRRFDRSLCIVLIVSYSAVELFIGYRSTAIMPLLAFLWLWDRCERPIRRRSLVAVALLLLVIIPITRDLRDSALAERDVLSTLADAFATVHSPIVASVHEMGGSMATVAYTYALVPSTRAFEAGQGYAYALLTVVPNLFWDIHPTIARGLESSWLVWTVDPFIAARQGGLGFSCIAEAYLNFGWTGVALIMAGVGFGVATLVRLATHKNSATVLAMAAIVTAFLLRFPRDEAASVVRAIAWYSAAPCGAVALIRSISKRSRRPGSFVAAARSGADIRISATPETWALRR